MPPASFTPRRAPVVSAKSRTASSITSATGGVAEVVSLPVEVLMKSPPASRDSHDARRALLGEDPVGRDYVVEHAVNGTLSIMNREWKYIEPSRAQRIMRPTLAAAGL